MNNSKRAKRAAKALHYYLDGESLSKQEGLVDLLTDLRHYASQNKIHFGQCLARAGRNYEAEKGLGSSDS